MADSNSGDALAGVDLTDDEYTIKQHLIRNKYRVYGPEGDLRVKAKQKLFKMREEFPFVSPDGDPIFRVKASNILDIAGDYTLVDERTDDPIAVLSKHFTFFHHVWTVTDPSGEELAKIESRSALVEALRSISTLFSLIPHSYSIETAEGEQVGSIEGRFSVRDVYDLTVDSGDVPKETLVASAIAIDALEGN